MDRKLLRGDVKGGGTVAKPTYRILAEGRPGFDQISRVGNFL